MDKYKVTIITVTYNCENSIAKTIESIINQTYNNIEYLIIDGNSTDNTINIIKKYAELDSRIKYISETDEGIYDAMNKGISMSSGDILNFINSADLILDKTAIENIVTEFTLNKNVELLYSNIVAGDNYIKYNNRINKISFIRRKSICHQAMFVKRNIFDKTGLYDTKYKIVADRDWFIKCYKNKVTMKHIDKFYIFFDVNGVSSDKKRINQIKNESKEIIIKHFGIWLWNLRKIIELRYSILED